MKKVYLVVSHAVDNQEDLGVGTWLFETEKDAKQFFDKLVTDEKEYINDDWVVKESDWQFETYEEGYYIHNHSVIEIRDLIIDKAQ